MQVRPAALAACSTEPSPSHTKATKQGSAARQTRLGMAGHGGLGHGKCMGSLQPGGPVCGGVGGGWGGLGGPGRHSLGFTAMTGTNWVTWQTCTASRHSNDQSSPSQTLRARRHTGYSCGCGESTAAGVLQGGPRFQDAGLGVRCCKSGRTPPARRGFAEQAVVSRRGGWPGVHMACMPVLHGVLALQGLAQRPAPTHHLERAVHALADQPVHQRIVRVGAILRGQGQQCGGG